MQGQSDEFIRDIFALVIKPVILNKVLPLVDQVCSKHLNGLTPKDKVTVAKFRSTMAKINERIMIRLFSPESIDSGTLLGGSS